MRDSADWRTRLVGDRAEDLRLGRGAGGWNLALRGTGPRVSLRFFAGLTMLKAADALGCLRREPWSGLDGRERRKRLKRSRAQVTDSPTSDLKTAASSEPAR